MRWSAVYLYVACAALAIGGDYNIDTVAGSAWVGDNGPATAAILAQAQGLCADINGYLYIADAADHRVRRVSPDGTIRTIAGTGVRGFSGDGGPAAAAQLNSPYGLACDVRGNLYIADLGNARVRRVGGDGTITTVAGGGSLAAGGPNEGSPATILALAAPRNVALDSLGNLYISDFTGQRVYMVTPGGTMTTVAGTGVAGYSGDGAAAQRAQVAFPAGLSLDQQGSLYIADSANHTIRKVTRGVIAPVARAATPTGLALDGAGALYIADSSAGQVLKFPVVGPATKMSIAANDLAFGFDGNLYVSSGAAVLRIAASGAVTAFAGGGSSAFGDQGSATQARLNHPSGVALDASGNLYIADRDNHRIRRVSADGTITTVAGTGQPGDSGDGASATQAQLNAPSSVSVDAAGNLYIADTGNHRVRRVTPDGRITAATNQGLLAPVYAIPDAAGDIYIADADAGKILKAPVGGVPATLVSGLASPRGLALDRQGNLYFTEASGARVHRLAPDGTLTSIADGVWNIPRGVAVDGSGNIFVADTGLQRVFRVDSSGQAAPIAGTGAPGFSGDGGAALAAQLGYPWDVALGPGGVMAVADLDNNRVRFLTPPSQPVVSPLVQVDAVNAASLAPGPVAAGMLVLLRGTGLTPDQAGDVLVLFGAFQARVLSIDASGLLVFVPPQIAGSGNVTISVIRQGVLAAQIQETVADAAPALFTAIGNQDGSVNSQANSAARGSVVSLYGTGLGVSGAPVSVTVGGAPADVLYAGPVEGYPGLFQVNASVPGGYLASGDLDVVVTVGAASSQSGVGVWVE